MANVTLSEEQARAINAALHEADVFLARLEQLATTARPIRRDDIQAPALRMALDAARAIDLPDAKKRKP